MKFQKSLKFFQKIQKLFKKGSESIQKEISLKNFKKCFKNVFSQIFFQKFSKNFQIFFSKTVFIEKNSKKFQIFFQKDF